MPIKSLYASLLVGGSLGFLLFYYVLGLRILDPTYIDWLLLRLDPAQHYLGWLFFRNEAWHFPPGLITNYGEPLATSIAYTDSIPLVAIFFKLGKAILPPTFQYFGLWMLSCFLLQGIFGILLMRLITDNIIKQAAGALFFLMSPIMIFRAVHAEALMAHWLLLAALWLTFSMHTQKKFWLWVLLISLALSIHAYLCGMLIALASAQMLRLWLFAKSIKLKDLVIFFAANLGSLFAVGYLIGLFAAKYSGANGFEVAAMNLNALSNPVWGWSALLPERALLSFNQIDGFNYLGIGFMLLLLSAFFLLLNDCRSIKIDKEYLPLFLVSCLFVILALSNNISFDAKVIFHYSDRLLKPFFTVFRAGARMFWPVYYLLLFLSLWLLQAKLKSKNLALILLLCLVTVQFFDLSAGFTNFRGNYIAPARYLPDSYLLWSQEQWQSHLQAAQWQTIAGKYKKIVFVPAQAKVGNDFAATISYMPVRSKFDYRDFAFFAAQNKMSINTGYFARLDEKKLSAYNAQLLQEIAAGNFARDSIYILRDDKMAEKIRPLLQDKDSILLLDGYTVFAPNWLDTDYRR